MFTRAVKLMKRVADIANFGKSRIVIKKMSGAKK